MALTALVALGPLAPAAPAASAEAETVGSDPSAAAKGEPRPPLLPENFRGRGRWVVRDLGFSVPFKWRASDGDMQMIAGGPDHPIWFTNLIYHNTAYTQTLRWPNVTDHSCSRFDGFINLHLLNERLKTARFVGREILERGQRRRVNHWRVGIVTPPAPPGVAFRFPFALADVYVAQRDRTRWWQMLLFGIPNLFDPELDEWGVMKTWDHRPGKVTLPADCPPPPP
jgi:hypothetical protein